MTRSKVEIEIHSRHETSREQEQEDVLCRGLPPRGEPAIPGISLIFLGISLLLLNGCGTIYALQKLPPQVQLSKYESVFLSQDNDIVFRFNVSIEETKVNKQGFKVRQLNENVERAMWKERHEEIWCAKLSYEEVTKNSILIELNDKNLHDINHLDNLNPITSSNYNIIKSDCLDQASSENVIPFYKYYYSVSNNQYYNLKSDVSAFVPNESSEKYNIYFIQKVKDESNNSKISKLKPPITNDWAYSKIRLAFLPVLFIADVAFFPLEMLYFYSAR